MLLMAKNWFYKIMATLSIIIIYPELITAGEKKPGSFRAGEYGYTETGKDLGGAAKYLSAEVGYVIIAAMIIIGTFLIGAGLYKRAQSEQAHDAKGSLMRVGIGSALVVFALIIGLAIKTLTESTN